MPDQIFKDSNNMGGRSSGGAVAEMINIDDGMLNR